MLNMTDFSTTELMELVLENAYQGVIVIDDKGIVRYFNSAMERISGLKRQEIIGKHVTSYSKVTRMHLVLESGEAELGIKCQQWDNVILNRAPIRKNGRIIGAVGMFLFKEWELNDLVSKLDKLEDTVKNYKQRLRDILAADYELGDIVGQSDSIAKCKVLARRVADTEASVLITGESGTGKELFAHAIHNLSRRRSKPFVKVNCASIPSELIEAELFGYEPGAFTGALNKTKMGKFQLADKGTLFLDEVGDMPLDMQAKVLRALQSKEIERLGGNRSYKMDFRVIAATNMDLTKALRENRFRSDLYYRLNVVPFQLEPLRKRTGDTSILVNFFLSGIARQNNRPKPRISPQALGILEAHSWPGNVRELLNTIIYSASNSEGTVIEPRHLPPDLLSSEHLAEEAVPVGSLSRTAKDSQKQAIITALAQAGGNKTKAAGLLNIHRATLYKKIKAYGISPDMV